MRGHHGRPKPCCPTCGGPAPKPRPIQDRTRPYDVERAFELAKEILAALPVEPDLLVAQRRRDLLRDAGGYAVSPIEPEGVAVKGPDGITRWVAA